MSANKIVGKMKEETKYLLRYVQIFMEDTTMEFALTKCRINGISTGEWQKQDGYTIASGDEEFKFIKGMD